MTADPRIRHRTKGFTLLEILLALGLSVVLLLAVAAAIDLYRRMTVAGHDEVSEARLVRAVLRKIESDIRSVVPPQSQVTTPSDSTGTLTATTIQSAMANPIQNATAQTVFGIYGDQRTLMLNTLCSHRAMVAAPDPSGAQPLTSMHGDLKTVAYLVTGAGGGTSTTPLSSGTSAPTSGLARLEGEHLTIGSTAMQSGSIASQARVIAPEVASIAFRYFDGAAWQTSWDASYLQALPKAIECTITLRPPEAATSTLSATATTAQAQPRIYRQVIAISSMAQPVPVGQLATLPTGVVP